MATDPPSSLDPTNGQNDHTPQPAKNLGSFEISMQIHKELAEQSAPGLFERVFSWLFGAYEVPVQASCRGLLASSSDFNLVSQRCLDDIGNDRTIATSEEIIPTVTQGSHDLKIVGVINVTWHVDGNPHKVYSTDFKVISRDVPCDFDFLLGRHWIEQAGALRRNREVL